MAIECFLCSDKENNDDNKIIKCANCLFSAHVLCYGIPVEDHFMCAPCRENVSAENISCAICLKKGGALKTTTDEKWAHVMCALFTKDAEFVDSETMEPIDISNCRMNKKAKCTFCDESHGVLKCKKRNCKENLHVSCGLANGSLREILNTKDGSLMFIGYCAAHAKEDAECRRLSADHIKRVLKSRTRKRLQEQAAKSNAEWIKNAIEEDDHEASIVCNDISDEATEITSENADVSNDRQIEQSNKPDGNVSQTGNSVVSTSSNGEDSEESSTRGGNSTAQKRNAKSLDEDDVSNLLDNSEDSHQCYKDDCIKRVSISQS